MEITIYSILIWITAILIGSLALVIYLGSNKLSTRVFAVSIFLVMLWTIAVGINIATRNYDVAELTVKFCYYLGTIISASFLYFFYTFPNDNRPSKFFTILVIILELLLFPLFAFTGLVVGQPLALQTSTVFWGWGFGPLWFLFDIFYYSYFASGLYILWKKFKSALVREERVRLKFIIISVTVGVIPPTVTAIVLPRLGIFGLNWLGPLTGVVWITLISYSILKHQQMSVKIVTAEVLTIGMAIAFFINIFAGFPIGVVGRIVTFVVFVLLGYFLIKGILRESVQREQLNDLNVHLQEKVDLQTKEIKKSYEIEKKARVELQKLDQNKNDFIIITQHHLRTPLAQIRWQANSIIKGLYGDISTELSETISRIDKASEKLTKTVNDFLAITQLKIGTNVLNVQPINLKNVFETLLDEFSSEIKKKKITVSFEKGDNWPHVIADQEKMKDVFAIILDNAIQYNHKEGGELGIQTVQKNDMLVVNVTNTGIGLSKSDKTNLFKQSFFRTNEAKKVNPLGIGVGLLVAKTIIEAHQGSIVIESDGERKEVEILIKLPIAKN